MDFFGSFFAACCVEYSVLGPLTVGDVLIVLGYMVASPLRTFFYLCRLSTKPITLNRRRRRHFYRFLIFFMSDTCRCRSSPPFKPTCLLPTKPINLIYKFTFIFFKLFLTFSSSQLIIFIHLFTSPNATNQLILGKSM